MLVNMNSSSVSYSPITKIDPMVKKITNLLIKHGKRSKAEKVLSKALQHLDNNYPGQSMKILYLAIIGAKQDIAVRLRPKPKKRRNKKSFNVYLPRVISPNCGVSLGIRSILKSSRERSEASLLPFWKSLSEELFKASQGKGEVIAKRYSVNKLARSNKRRIHFLTRR